jgi:ABC-type thiamin/hydroxymethylpyrimidine transport system permease subunit
MNEERHIIVGVICLALVVCILLVGKTGGAVAPAVILAVLRICGIVVS